MRQSWASNYLFNISAEWRVAPRSWIGWANRLLCVVNLRIMGRRRPGEARSRLTVVRYMRFYSYGCDEPVGTIWTVAT